MKHIIFSILSIMVFYNSAHAECPSLYPTSAKRGMILQSIVAMVLKAKKSGGKPIEILDEERSLEILNNHTPKSTFTWESINIDGACGFEFAPIDNPPEKIQVLFK